ncbi:MAG: GntR family transcriptional regulator [Pseudomonadota bacterium]
MGKELHERANIEVAQLPTAGQVRRGQSNPLWRQISDQLRESIELGQFPLGAQLPSETAIAKHYDVNRHTVRHALTYLSSDGLVSATRGAGTYVTGGQTIAYDLCLGDTQVLHQGPNSARVRRTTISRSYEAAGHRLAALLNVPVNTGLFSVQVKLNFVRLPVGLLTHCVPSDRLPKFMDRFIQASSTSTALKELGFKDLRLRQHMVFGRRATKREAKLLGVDVDAPVVVSEALLKPKGGEPVAFEQGVFVADRVCLKV